MKLFYAPSSSSLLPHIILYEVGLPLTAIYVDEHTKEIEGVGDYRKITPLGYLPTLVLDDGTLLIEGPAIAQYISDQVPSKNLAPPYGTIERTKLQSWLNFCSSEMHKGGFSPLFYEGIMSALPPIATAKADFRKRSCLLYPRKRTFAGVVEMPISANKFTS